MYSHLKWFSSQSHYNIIIMSFILITPYIHEPWAQRSVIKLSGVSVGWISSGKWMLNWKWIRPNATSQLSAQKIKLEALSLGENALFNYPPLLNPSSASKRRERLSVQHWTLHWVLNKAVSGQFSKMSDTWSDIQKHKRRQESLRERLQRRRKDRQGLGLGDNDGKNWLMY